MKFVDSYVKKDFQAQTTEQLYNKSGELCSDSEKVFAKVVEINTSNNKQIKYLIATNNNIPYDPNGIDSHRESNLTINLKSVSKSVFDYYVLYLRTKNSLYMTRTQRSYINV
jgi:hypothetical protein